MKYTRHTEAIQALGAHVLSLRRARRWSQEELANRCDLELSQISRIERGVINTNILKNLDNNLTLFIDLT